MLLLIKIKLKDYISYRYLKENQLFIECKTIDELILLCVDDNLKEIEINNRLGIRCCPLIPRLDYQNDIAYLELEKHIKAIFNSLENILITIFYKILKAKLLQEK